MSQTLVNRMIERRRLPSASYYSPDDEVWSRELFAEQSVAVHAAYKDIAQVARHVALQQTCAMPFFVMDIPTVESRIEDWTGRLSRVRPFFALRCNPDPVLSRLLIDSDVGFEVTNMVELGMALEMVSADRIIYNNPLSTRKSMKTLGERGVGCIVIENEKQLCDAISYADQASLLLSVDLGGVGLGCDLETAESLIMSAFELRARLVGINFTLDPRCDPSVYYKALREVRQLFDLAETCGLQFDTIGLGDGFPSSKKDIQNVFPEMCDVINAGLDQLFAGRGIKVVATPGRYFSAAAFVLCTNVIGKRALEARYITKDDFDDGVGYIYQINDGIYGSFGCRLLDYQPQFKPLNDMGVIVEDEEVHFGTVLGPTLDGIDVAQSLVRCRQLHMGEWLLWEDMGAHSIPLEADYPVPPVYYYSGKDNWDRIKGKHCMVGVGDGVVSTESADVELHLHQSGQHHSTPMDDASSDMSSDVESLVDDDDLAECFDLFFVRI